MNKFSAVMRTRCLLAWMAINAGLVSAQTAPRLTLSQAEEIALRGHPRIASAKLVAQATGSVVNQVRAAYYPTLIGSLTSVGTGEPETIAAGALTTSSVYSRAASGLAINQLITDFGRTANLAESARLRAAAQGQNVNNTRVQILLQVQQAYYRVLAAESILKVAQATVDIRRLTVRQVTALAQSSLRSTLDVSFAQVNLSEAELALYRAENDAKASHARLSAGLGYERNEPFEIADEPLPAPLDPDPEILVAKALRDRPDLATLQLNQSAAQRYAEAEKRLRYPSISVLAAAGALPVHDQRLGNNYSAAGLNVSIPFLNGGLFSSRRAEAEFRAQAISKDAEDLSVQIARDVRVAWLEASNTFRRLDVTARLVDQANQSLRLAQARYDLGLGSIVELNQAQLSQTSAQFAAASAKYDYLIQRAVLDYAVGARR